MKKNKNKPRDCWEFMDCPEKVKAVCNVYKLGMGNKCWYLMHVKEACPNADMVESCFDCQWYLEKEDQE
ncbi:hypothetical protein KKC60_00075 [Patescibacteria group bacterium]|nr:hypothetical protein [Patescibacteria group bacterium]